ncbi:putative ADP-ribosylglycohydrolase [Enhygromyxa salina]|uniref:Putative ADP-ribosylglycohydrolase n=1 Tax=Enhygromyxa salina TaxID=215803 RepID=A0A0C1ZFE3_9BACT|nr:ADP-ribosylglycohydrolase family protein [Enhygromyxa salina]KIG16369.1 putative ADP-ribosylglycohydrolase [Enhygromyxa salina]
MTLPESDDHADAVLGVLLGTAIGDSIGLPFEGLSPQRVERRLARRPLGHSLVLGRGMISDDTEHTSMVARALLRSNGDPRQFARAFARSLRWWVLALPPGVGLATLRGGLRSWVGFSPERSGVHSAGNGPAMRAALLGLRARDDAHLVELVRASTRVTHTDPRAEAGALLVSRWAREGGAPTERLVELAAQIEDPELRAQVLRAIEAANRGDTPAALAAELGWTRGVSGFVVHTLPAVAYCWLRHRGDPRSAIEAAIRLGGDTDTVAAIVGALAGAEVGARGLPAEWIEGIRDWPIGVAHLRALAAALTNRELAAPRISWAGLLGRNLLVLGIVVTHVLARLLGR